MSKGYNPYLSGLYGDGNGIDLVNININANNKMGGINNQASINQKPKN